MMCATALQATSSLRITPSIALTEPPAAQADGGSVKAMDGVIRRLDVACKAVAHIMQEKGFADDDLKGYPEEVRSELKSLAYRLFREAYDTTKAARKNREVAAFLRRKIKD